MLAFDEMYGPGGGYRFPLCHLGDRLDCLPPERLRQKREEAALLFRRLGITFAVNSGKGDTERLIPCDVIPRVFTAAEWRHLADGSVQRVRALNSFLHDIYHRREILRAGVVPAELILANDFYEPQMYGIDVPGQVYVHVGGIDIVRVAEYQFYVLEDNLRSPSGVSYMLENREVMMRLLTRVALAKGSLVVNSSQGGGTKDTWVLEG